MGRPTKVRSTGFVSLFYCWIQAEFFDSVKDSLCWFDYGGNGLEDCAGKGYTKGCRSGAVIGDTRLSCVLD